MTRGGYYPPSSSSVTHASVPSSIEDRMREIAESLARLQAEISGRTLAASSASASQYTIAASSASASQYSVYPSVVPEAEADLLNLQEINEPVPYVQQSNAFAIPPVVPSSNYFPTTYSSPPPKSRAPTHLDSPTSSPKANSPPPVDYVPTALSVYSTSGLSHLTSPLAGTHLRLIDSDPRDRQPHCKVITPMPIKVYFISRHQFRRGRGNNITHWRIRINETYPGAIDEWSIAVQGGDYIFEAHECSLVILGQKNDDPPVLK